MNWLLWRENMMKKMKYKLRIKLYKIFSHFIALKNKILTKHKEKAHLQNQWQNKMLFQLETIGMISHINNINIMSNNIMMKVLKEVVWIDQCHLQIFQIKNIVIQKDLRFQVQFNKYGVRQIMDCQIMDCQIILCRKWVMQITNFQN
jgi:hypothetical protein